MDTVFSALKRTERRAMSLTGKWFGFGRSEAYDEGVRAYDRNQFEEAADAFERALQRNSDPATGRLARYYLVECYRRLAESELTANRAEAALFLAEKSIDLQPGYPDLHLLRARICSNLGRSEDEAASVSKALELNPSYAEAKYYSALIEYGRGDRSAIDRMLEATKTDGDLAGPAFEAGLAADREGDTAGALALFRSRIGAVADDANFHLALAEGRVRAGEFAEAVLEFEKALRLAPGYADIRCKYAQVLLQLDRLEEADRQITAAIEINPRYADALACRGVLLRRLGRPDEARSAFRMALDVDPHHAVALMEIGRL